MSSDRTLTILPWTDYSSFAVPVDYPPSRDFRPRWGNTRQPIQAIAEWFSEHASMYREFIGLMRQHANELAEVPLEFHESQLPMPAWHGAAYAPFDALALYTIMATGKPKRYMEIGSGITTCWAHFAKRKAGLDTRIISIDPEPRASIDAICDEVIRDGLETCDPSIVDQLEAGDILFFDGTHRSFMNSDVTVFFIDILPRLNPGVLIHIHDIHLPYDYPEWAKPWYWNEQYMLAVYMMAAKDRIDPVLPTGFICRDAAFEDDLAQPLRDLGAFNNGWLHGGSMWFTHRASLLDPNSL